MSQCYRNTFQINIPNIRPSQIIPKGPNSMRIQTRGGVDATIDTGIYAEEEVYILYQRNVGLMSRDVSVKLEIVKQVGAIIRNIFQGLDQEKFNSEKTLSNIHSTYPY